MLLVQGVVFFFLYYFTFRFLIVRLNLKTLGREDIEEDELMDNTEITSNTEFAEVILANIGGKENITNIDHCTTRLRLELKDSSLVNEKAIKKAGAMGVVIPSKKTAQIIVGTTVQFVTDELKRITK